MRPASSVRRGPCRTGTARLVLAATGIVQLSSCPLLSSQADPTPADPGPTASERATPREGALLAEGTTEVDVAPGDTVQVSLPEGSLGVGDYWGVVAVDEPSVAGADVAIGEAVFGVEPAAEGTHSTGGNQQFAVEIRGLTAGETTVRALYRTQTRTVSQDCDQSRDTLDAPVEPVEITVRVG